MHSQKYSYQFSENWGGWLKSRKSISVPISSFQSVSGLEILITLPRAKSKSKNKLSLQFKALLKNHQVVFLSIEIFLQIYCHNRENWQKKLLESQSSIILIHEHLFFMYFIALNHKSSENCPWWTKVNFIIQVTNISLYIYAFVKLFVQIYNGFLSLISSQFNQNKKIDLLRIGYILNWHMTVKASQWNKMFGVKTFRPERYWFSLFHIPIPQLFSEKIQPSIKT